MGIDGKQVEQWLLDIGCVPTKIENPQANWQFQVNFPPGGAHIMHVANPIERPRALIIATGTQVSPEHIEAFAELDDDAKSDFLSDLACTLNHEFVEFQTKGMEDGHSCPKAFEITATRFDDGLTLDSLARSISSVYKTELAGIMCVQKHLGRRGYTDGGRFDFRRLGIQ